ncbi:ABC transporter substrate-binding protein [Hydrogenophilus thermoluteolus]|nr:ABC transporter substrate-binding protein [Hydrogenophilus thermoluteolus]
MTLTKTTANEPQSISRRKALKTLGKLTATSLAAAHAPWVHAANTLKIGLVSPQTGPLSVFTEPDAFVLGAIRSYLANGIQAGGKKWSVEIIVKDSQSNSSRAAEVTNELIYKDGVDLVLAASTPETTNPVADTCELNGVPCITNDTPWQPHFFGRGGDPKKGFEWTYHFFWGLEDIIAVFTGIWDKLPTNRVVGALWPNDPDGNAWADPKLGFPAVAEKKKLTFVDTGRFPLPADNFASQIIEFKNRGVEIVTGVVPPPDFGNFWAQAAQQGFHPKIVTVAKATEFPAAVKAFGDRANGLSVEVWWSPQHPFKSSLTGQSSAEIAAAYTQATGRQWSMPLGFKYSLFEVALDAFVRAGGNSREALRDAIRTTNLETLVGPVNFQTGPVPNISKTPLVGGQWQKRGQGFELVIVENGIAPMIPIGGELLPIT